MYIVYTYIRLNKARILNSFHLIITTNRDSYIIKYSITVYTFTA